MGCESSSFRKERYDEPIVRRLVFLVLVSPAVAACTRIDLPPRPQPAVPDASFLFDAGVPEAGPTPHCDDVAVDFSLTDNPTGPWSYGYEFEPGIFSPLPNEQAFGPADLWVTSLTGGAQPAVGFNPTSQTVTWFQTADVPAGAVVLMPGLEGESAVVRWTSPVKRTIALGGRFVGLSIKPPTTVDVHVLHGAGSLFDGEINLGDASGGDAAFGLTEPVDVGDTVDFVVGWGGAGGSLDATQLVATVCYLP